jgi:hypothetical protein
MSIIFFSTEERLWEENRSALSIIGDPRTVLYIPLKLPKINFKFLIEHEFNA